MASITADWRTAADPDDLREYDRFGPWIDHIGEPADMPRRFRQWWPELGEATYLLKVPRAYDRAQVRPGMDLFESVLAAFPDRLCVLRAQPGEIVRTDVARDEIVASVRHTNLLIGRWSSLLADGTRVDVEFNSVSHALITEVERFLMSDDLTSATPVPTPEVAPADHFHKSVLNTLNAGEPLRIRPVHVEEPGRPCRTDRGRRRRAAGLVVLASGADLVLFNRDLAVQPRFRRANYAYNLIRVPFRRITSFEVRSPLDTSPPGFCQLVLRCREQEIVQPCLTRPDAVAALLDAHGVARTGQD